MSARLNHDGNQVGPTPPLTKLGLQHNAKDGTEEPLGIIPAFYNTETQRFSGNDDEFWLDFLDRFELIAFECCKLSQSEALRFLPISLTGPALAFYRLNIKGKKLSYEKAVKLLRKSFHDANRERRIWHRIRNVRFEMYLDGKRTISEAYELLIDDLHILFPQVAQAYQCDSFRRDSLERASVGHDWFSHILARPSQELPTFTTLNHALGHAAQHFVESLGQQGKKDDIYGMEKVKVTKSTPRAGHSQPRNTTVNKRKSRN